MEPSKVYFTDFHTVAFGDGLPTKLKKLIKKPVSKNWIWTANLLLLRCTSENWEISVIFVLTMQKRLQT